MPCYKLQKTPFTLVLQPLINISLCCVLWMLHCSCSASLYVVKVLRGAPPAETKDEQTASRAAASDVRLHVHFSVDDGRCGWNSICTVAKELVGSHMNNHVVSTVMIRSPLILLSALQLINSRMLMGQRASDLGILACVQLLFVSHIYLFAISTQSPNFSSF